MGQEVAQGQGGCNLMYAVEDFGEMTSLAHIDMEDGSLVLFVRNCQVNQNGWIPNANC